jgi:hypothetical protein
MAHTLEKPMSRALFALAPLSLFVLGGCPPYASDDTGSYDSGVECDLMAYASVQLIVPMVDGLDSDVLLASYSASGAVPVNCESSDSDVSEDLQSEFICGWEVQGPIALHVEAQGFVPHDETIVIEADECHVITAEVTVTLVPEAVAE